MHGRFLQARVVGVSWIVLGLVLGGTATRSPAESFIVKDGQPRAQIVVASEPTPSQKVAAEELRNNIQKISGANLVITTEPSDMVPVRIYVGRSRYTDELGIRVEELKHGAYRVVSGDGWLALVGRDTPWEPQGLMKLAVQKESWTVPAGSNRYDRPLWKGWDKLTGEHWGLPFSQCPKDYCSELGMWAMDETGSFNAVTDFLRMQGMRWYMPGELGEIVPSKKDIAVPAIDRTVRPDFELRYPYLYGQRFGQGAGDLSNVLWQLRMGFSQAPDVLGVGYRAHGIGHVIGRAEVKEQHPEYYALIGGRRVTEDRFAKNGRPCLSAPGLIDANVRFVRAMFDVFDMPMESVMPVDGFTAICQCDLCQGKSRPERGWNGQFSDYVWNYCNEVAKEVYKTHPDRKVVGMAYTTYMLPPTNIDRLSPNLVVCIAQGRCGFGQDPAARKFMQDLRQEWLKKLPAGEKSLYVYEYYRYAVPGKDGEFAPAFSPHAIAADLKDLKGISLGDYIEVHTQSAKLITALNMYVTGRWWWDANQDIDAVLDEYYTLFYGPAREEMKSFIEYAEGNWMDLKKVEKIDKVFELLAAAQNKVPEGSVYAQRIQMIADYIAPLKARKEQLSQPRDLGPRAVLVEGKEGTITLDGKLDEPAWQDLRTYGLRDVKTGKIPAIKTRFHIFWAKDALYMGIVCDEPDMTNVNISTKLNDDTSMWSGDEVELLIETQVHRYYQLCVNPAGALLDLDHNKGLRTVWSSNAEVGVDRGEKAWTAEIRIPVADEGQANIDADNGVAGRMPSNAYPWYFNVCRQRVRGDQIEQGAFSPTGAGFRQPRKFAEMGGIIRDPEERARREELQKQWQKQWE